jgi:single-strand DNA-binding protein
VAFGKLGEIVGTYLKKGRAVLVSGRLNNSSYIAKDGTKKYSTEVVLEDFNFLASGKKKTAAVAA